jgi:transposase-like protein
VKRPSSSALKAEIEKLGYSGVGRKYGVSDNAVRKWIKAYKSEKS